MLSMHFQMNARNNAWSNDRLYRAFTALIETAPSPDEIAGSSPSPSPSPSPGALEAVRQSLADLQSLDGGVVPALESKGAPFAILETPATGIDAIGLARAQADLDRRLIRFCEGLDDDRLLSRVVLIHRGRPGKEAVHAVLGHLFTLQAHLRGIACARIAEAGGQAPNLDGFFLEADRMDRAADLIRLGLEEGEAGDF